MTVAILAFAGFTAALVVITALIMKWDKRRSSGRAEQARSLARSMGYDFVTREELPEDAHFPLFARRGKNRSRDVAQVVCRPGEADRGFEYSYVTGSGRDRTSEWFACALIRLDFDTPPLTIVERGFTSAFAAGKEGDKFRFGDIAPSGSITPEQDLDDDFRFYGDRSFAAELLSLAFRQVLTSEDWKRTSIGFNGRWMLCCSKERSIDARIRFLIWARALRDAAPHTLVRTYPLQTDDR